MSLSFMARIRFQSVLEAFEEGRFFISACSAKRDDMNVLLSLSVSDGYSYATEKSERDEALLSVVESIILKGEGCSFEHPLCVQKIKAVNLEVDPTLRASKVMRIGIVYIRLYRGCQRELAAGAFLR